MLEPALDAILRSVPGWADAEFEVEPLEGGITNRNYVVTVGGARYVLRVPGHDTALLGIDRANEHRAAVVAAEAGVGPEVVAFLPQSGCFVTRFVQGAHVPVAELRSGDALDLVVASVRLLHASSPIPSTFPVFRIVERYRDTAAERGVRVPPAYDDAHALAGRIEGSFAAAPSPLATCHNDLLNANFLRDGDHVWIVDYEYAGMGDVFFDLGNLTINNGLDDDARDRLLHRYFLGDVLDRHRARLALMTLMSDFREAMWGVVQQAISALDVDFVDYAGRHFARMLDGAETMPVDDLLEHAAQPI